MENPYIKRKRTTAPEIDFDAVCPPDNMLLEVLAAAEKIFLDTHGQFSSTIDIASLNTVTQETDPRYSQPESTAFNLKAVQNLTTTSDSKFGNATSSLSDRTALLRLSVCPIKPSFQPVTAPSSSTDVSPNDPPHFSAAASGPVKSYNGSRDFASDDSDGLSDDDDAGGCLTQMVREECHDLHSNPEQRKLAMQLVDMRKSLEKYVSDLTQRHVQARSSLRMGDKRESKSLDQQIQALSRAGVISKDLTDAMHKIRALGNEGAHHHANSLPPKKTCEAAYKSYLALKKNFDARNKT